MGWKLFIRIWPTQICLGSEHLVGCVGNQADWELTISYGGNKLHCLLQPTTKADKMLPAITSQFLNARNIEVSARKAKKFGKKL